MNGAQDLGGTMGHGPVNPEPDEPVFHADWESKVLALTLAMGFYGAWNIDTNRFTRESLPPTQYLSSSYYQIWFAALCKLLVSRGFLSERELSTGQQIDPPRELPRPKPLAADIAPILAKGGPANRDACSPARFKAGDKIRTLNINPQTHTRLARYLRTRAGEIVHVHGVYVFPDTNAHGKGENPQWLYTVRFSARELWGDDHPAGDSVHADLWEPYLEPA